MRFQAASIWHEDTGSALVYILIAIALLGALTVTFMQPSSQQTSSQSSFRTVTAVQSQADVIRAAIQECILRYSNGDTTVDTSANALDEGADTTFPLRPDSDHFTSPASDRMARNIRCPGDHPAGTPADHGRIFGGGRYLPPPPDLFGEWQYYNGTDGVFFWAATGNSDAFLLTALEKLDENYSECEADIVDATGGAVSLTSASAGTNNSVNCPSGNVCFRVRMLTKNSPVWNGDTDGDESSCT